LNNLAVIHQNRGERSAVDYAERAFAQQPNDAAVADTLGWALVEFGDLQRGVSLLEKASLLAPQQPSIRYHLAAGLAKAGRERDAARHLDALLLEQRGFPEEAEARALLSELRGKLPTS
jgi:predicted Zn-dependent protease